MRLFLRYVLLAAALCAAAPLRAQDAGMVQAGSAAADGSGMEEVSVAGEEIQIDSSLYGTDIFSAIPESVVVRQDPRIRLALGDKIASDAEKTVNGFSIRLFIDNRRNAREASLEVLRRFNELYPYINVYRSYSAPNFKVTAGSFRNRVEAQRMLDAIKDEFPDAFIVRDKFRYPSIGDPDVWRRKEAADSVVTAGFAEHGTGGVPR